MTCLLTRGADVESKEEWETQSEKLLIFDSAFLILHFLILRFLSGYLCVAFVE